MSVLGAALEEAQAAQRLREEQSLGAGGDADEGENPGEDDGETTAYASGQGVRRTSLAWDDGAATLTWTCKGAAAAGDTR